MLTRLLSPKILGGSHILAGILGILLAISQYRLSHAKEVIQGLTVWQGEMVDTVRLASGNSDTTRDTAKVQVQAMGQTIAGLHAAIQRSNDKVNELEAASKAAIDAGKATARKREAELKTTERARDEILKSGGTVRSIQDQVFEAGL